MSFDAVEITHFLRAFVNTLSFFGLHQAGQCQRPYYWCARVGGWQVKVGPPPPPLRGRPRRLTEGRGAAVPAPARTVSGIVSHYRGHVRGKKQQTFYKCTQKIIISIPPRDTKPEFRGHGKVIFHIALEFSDCDEPFVPKSSENGQIGRAVDSRRWPGMTQGRLCVRQWGRGTRAAVTQRARVKCVVIDKPSDARLRNQASVTEQDVRKRLMCDLPVSFPYHNR